MNLKTIFLSFCTFSFVAAPCFAMKKDEPAHPITSNNYIVKTLNVTIDVNPFESFKVPLKLSVRTPDSLKTAEEKNAYYQSCKGSYVGKLQEVLRVYQDQLQNPAIGNHISSIRPTELVFTPDENRFTILRHWDTEHVADMVKGSLDTRMECTYIPGKLISEDPLLDITYAQSSQKESIKINTLFNMFPVKTYLNFNPDNIQENHQHIVAMSIQRAIGIQQGKNPAQLPDPRKYEDTLHLADLKKMVTHYLSTKK